MKVYHVQPSMTEYSNWVPNREIVRNMEDADLVFFEGGEDLHPSLYNHPIHETCGHNIHRDEFEIAKFNQAKSLNIPTIGICRGAQFLCAMSGGTLIQHQQSQPYNHEVILEDGSKIMTTSSHHQAQNPVNLPVEDYRIIGWTENLSKFHLDGYNKEVNPAKECEIVYYRNTHSLGIQGHPEWMNSHPDIKFYQNLLQQFLNKEL